MLVPKCKISFYQFWTFWLLVNWCNRCMKRTMLQELYFQTQNLYNFKQTLVFRWIQKLLRSKAKGASLTGVILLQVLVNSNLSSS